MGIARTTGTMTSRAALEIICGPLSDTAGSIASSSSGLGATIPGVDDLEGSFEFEGSGGGVNGQRDRELCTIGSPGGWCVFAPETELLFRAGTHGARGSTDWTHS